MSLVVLIFFVVQNLMILLICIFVNKYVGLKDILKMILGDVDFDQVLIVLYEKKILL